MSEATTDILYVCKNRLEYVKHTFKALLNHTDWTQVATLFIADDNSTDGTYQHLCEQLDVIEGKKIEYRFFRNFGGPVGAMNKYLDIAHDGGWSDRFVKIDSDFVVCSGWLEEVLRQMTLHPEFDVFGLQPRLGPAVAPPCPHRNVEEARFIGGIGAIRHRIFETCRPRPNGPGGRFGWTEYQSAHAFRKAWVTPDLPAFCLDLLPFEPWLSLAKSYIDKGWMRPWPKYDGMGQSYWGDWVAEDPEARSVV